MDQGKVAEVGSPLELLSRHDDLPSDNRESSIRGIFRGLVEGLGPERQRAFLDIAERHKQGK